MAQDIIKCPKCGETIKLSQAISQDIEKGLKKQHESEIASIKKAASLELKNKEREVESILIKERVSIKEKAKREVEEMQRIELLDLQNQVKEKTQQLLKAQDEKLSLRKRERDLADKEKLLTLDVENRVQKEKDKIKSEALREASMKGKKEIKLMQDRLAETQKDLESAQRTELDFRNKQRELEKDKQKLELEVARQVDEERNKIREETLHVAAEEHKLKDAEKERQFEAMKKQIDELKRKAEQGSQKVQGQVLEAELEDILSQDSPFDIIEPISPGVKGGDILQTINTHSGKFCGKILWETKRTKSWSDKWIQKVKDDQREAKADIAVIVSEALPKGFHHFRQIDGVWVTDIPSASSLALALRVVLTKAANEQRIQAGKEGKMEAVYHYLTGQEFKNRVEAIVEGFIAMKDDLAKEKALMQRHWAKREKSMEKVIENAIGMHGDIEGIAGSTLPALKMLEIPNMELNDMHKEVLDKENEAWVEE